LSQFSHVEIAGLPIARIGTASVLDHVFSELNDGRGGWLVTANLDFLQRADASQAARELYSQADLILADGMPLLWVARILGKSLPERVAGSDLVWSLAERAAVEGKSLYLLGGDPGAAAEAADRF
jgi:N-acetylglucosaminyldiphosphoundecaprenol N-acetyl-beta-D-mannosaminyltransferase